MSRPHRAIRRTDKQGEHDALAIVLFQQLLRQRVEIQDGSFQTGWARNALGPSYSSNAFHKARAEDINLAWNAFATPVLA